eukprot:972295-Prymnesium_polylepis.1
MAAGVWRRTEGLLLLVLLPHLVDRAARLEAEVEIVAHLAEELAFRDLPVRVRLVCPVEARVQEVQQPWNMLAVRA